MRELEKRADANGNTYAAMMQRAGTLTAQALTEQWSVDAKRVLVLVGPGNNGGDGLVCARALHDASAKIFLYVWKREPREDDVNFQECRARGIEFTRAEEDKNLAHLKAEIARADFIVDAFLGTGVTRPIEGLLKQILEKVKTELGKDANQPTELISPNHRTTELSNHLTTQPSNHPTLLAVDLPTGLNPDNGALDPATVPADMTVTFAFPKVGQYTFPGANAVGQLLIADIGIPREWASDIPLDLATDEEIRARLPRRQRDSNKGTFGKAMIVAGSLEFTGAPVLAATAAGRAGAGLVTLALPRTIHPIVAGKLNEATYLPLPDAEGAWSPEAAKPLAERARDYQALLVGCGLGREESTLQFVRQLFGIDAAQSNDLPSVVIDADALYALAETERWWERAQFSAPPILTPHPGEMARLMGADIQKVQRDRIGVAGEFAKKWNAVVVLKGAFTVIAAPDQSATLIPFANPALATAGTGDVLAGTIAGFLAQYRAASTRAARGDDSAAEDAFNAALVGAYIHGLAGEFAAHRSGQAGALAGDLLPLLPEAINSVGVN